MQKNDRSSVTTAIELLSERNKCKPEEQAIIAHLSQQGIVPGQLGSLQLGSDHNGNTEHSSSTGTAPYDRHIVRPGVEPVPSLSSVGDEVADLPNERHNDSFLQFRLPVNAASTANAPIV